MTTTEKLEEFKKLLKIVKAGENAGEVSRSVIADIKMKIRLLEEGIEEGKRLMLAAVKWKSKGSCNGDRILTKEKLNELEKE